VTLVANVLEHGEARLHRGTLSRPDLAVAREALLVVRERCSRELDVVGQVVHIAQVQNALAHDALLSLDELVDVGAELGQLGVRARAQLRLRGIPLVRLLLDRPVARVADAVKLLRVAARFGSHTVEARELDGDLIARNAQVAQQRAVQDVAVVIARASALHRGEFVFHLAELGGDLLVLARECALRQLERRGVRRGCVGSLELNEQRAVPHLVL